MRVVFVELLLSKDNWKILGSWFFEEFIEAVDVLEGGDFNVVVR